MIPYIKSSSKIKEKINTVNCNAGLVILDNNTPILISLVDISIKNKKVASDLIGGKFPNISLKDRENIDFNKSISNYEGEFRFKSDRLGDYTHTVIHNSKISDYCIDWNNEGKCKIITKWLRNKRYMPVNEDIVQRIIDKYDKKDENKSHNYSNSYSYSIFNSCEVYTNNPEFEKLEVWKINHTWFNQELEMLDINSDANQVDDDKGKLNMDFDWNEIETIEDYILKFIDPIKNKLKENISILYNPKTISDEMFNSKYKPFDGQVPIIQSGIEVLNKDRFIYLACEMGTGKTLIGSKVNHLYYKNKENNNYTTLIVAPAITLTQWKEELDNSISDDIDVKIIKKTSEFIKFYNKTKLNVEKPTYFIVGKETFKLGYKKIAGINTKTKELKYKKEVINNSYYRSCAEVKKVKEKKDVVCCPDCGIPLKNTLRKKEDVFFNEKDFKGNPKKSTYKCYSCGNVLWQATYNKTMKTSVVDFIKRKNILFDSIIVDEAHEGNGDSLIGSSVKTLIRNHGKKILLLSGTSNNGYSSSLYNLCMALMPRTLRDNNVLDEQKFIKTYGTLMTVNKIKDGEYRRYGRNEVKESAFKEIEGINPIFFTKFLAQNFIFATLDDLRKDLPKLNEKYIGVNQLDELRMNESKLFNDIKSANSFNAEWYNDTIVKHYINNPWNWNPITISHHENGDKIVQPVNFDKEFLLPKEKELLKVIKQEISEGRKSWVFTDFTGGGDYMDGENIPCRLRRILENEGIKVYHLRASVSTYDRKEVIEKNKDKYDVFISNPRLVQVGLNMVWCSNYIVYIPSYHVNIISQAIRRGYRINSTQENRIYHLYYQNTIEQKVQERYQRKRAEAESIEGKFSVVLENEDKIRTASKLSKRINDSIG